MFARMSTRTRKFAIAGLFLLAALPTLACGNVPASNEPMINVSTGQSHPNEAACNEHPDLPGCPAVPAK